MTKKHNRLVEQTAEKVRWREKFTATRNTAARTVSLFTLLSILLAAVFVLAVNAGSVAIAPADIARMILSPAGFTDSVEYNILFKIRLPRIISAIVMGGALSLSGLLLQTFFRNPMAGPYVLGISSGSKMAVAVVIILAARVFGSISAIIVVAGSLAGALFATCTLLAISSRLKNMATLLVGGIMIGYICSALADFIVTWAQDYQIASLHLWALGSFSGISWASVKIACIILFPVSALAVLLSKPMNAYLMGEGYATSVGVSLKIFRVTLIALTGILSGTVTAFAGLISFVGIAIPQIARLLFATQKPAVLIPASFLSGSIFCVVCDIIARTALAPRELSISTVTAFFGAPVVIALLFRRNLRRNQQ